MLNIINIVQRGIAKSRFAVYLLLKVRNQCGVIISYYLSEGSEMEKNGEMLVAREAGPHCRKIVDVGSNVGQWLRLFSSFMEEEKKAIAFEPSPCAVELLKKEFAYEDWVTIHSIALSDTKGEIEFYEEHNAGQTSSLFKDTSLSNAKEVHVQVSTLDDELLAAGLSEGIDFLKIDAEGSDLLVLKGAISMLRRQSIGAIQFEYNYSWAYSGSTLKDALDWLSRLGYKTYIIRKDGLYVLDYKRYGEYFAYSNYLAISPRFTPIFMNLMRGEI
jgi:FkbM family methyltransferase